jgi:integrase
MIKAGSPVQANRVQALISTVFSFAVDADLMDANPCSRLRKRGAENKGTRVLSDDEIRQFWQRCVSPPVSRRVGLALRLTLLTGCRPGEAAGIARNELTSVDRSGEAAWLLPPDRSKNGRAHLVPLTESARSTIVAALDLISDDDDYLFPSPIQGGGPITGHALTVAMSRMAKKIAGAAKATWSADPPSPHDLRRTVSTRLAALGIPEEDRDAVFNHTPTGVGKKHYDQYDRAAEKRIALDAWSTQLQAILALEAAR